MKSKLNTYRSLLIISFLIINCLILYGVSATWIFFNTGADKATILHLPGELESAYQPKVNWNVKNQQGRSMETQTLRELEKDYKNAWYVKYSALASNNPFGLADYYTSDAKDYIERLLDYNRTNDIYTRGTSIQHNPELLFYSLDGKLVVFTDKNLETFEETYVDDKLLHRESSIGSYQVTMLLEDGFWRIRQLVKIASKKPSLGRRTVNVNKINKGINYYPKEHPWDMFGENFNDSIVQKDFVLLKKMDFNSVRIFIPYKAFGGPNVKISCLQQVHSLLDIAKKQQLKVLITLFDFYGNYDVLDWTLTHRHAEHIVNSLKNHDALLGWDIKNEPDLDYESRGKENVKAWLTAMAKQIKYGDTKHPITIGWSNPEAAIDLANEVDLVSFHYYGSIENLFNRYQKLKEQVPNKPLVLQEYGYSSYSGVWNGFISSENKQADYLKAIQKFISDEELPYFLWTLYDFEKIPNAVAGRLPWRKTKQKYFGLLDTGDKPKKAYQVLLKNKKGNN